MRIQETRWSRTRAIRTRTGRRGADESGGTRRFGLARGPLFGALSAFEVVVAASVGLADALGRTVHCPSRAAGVHLAGPEGDAIEVVRAVSGGRCGARVHQQVTDRHDLLRKQRGVHGPGRVRAVCRVRSGGIANHAERTAGLETGEVRPKPRTPARRDRLVAQAQSRTRRRRSRRTRSSARMRSPGWPPRTPRTDSSGSRPECAWCCSPSRTPSQTSTPPNSGLSIPEVRPKHQPERTVVRVSRRVVRRRDPAQRRSLLVSNRIRWKSPTTAASAVVANTSTASPTAPTIHERLMVSPSPCHVGCACSGTPSARPSPTPGPCLPARSCKAADPSHADSSQIVPPIPEQPRDRQPNRRDAHRGSGVAPSIRSRTTTLHPQPGMRQVSQPARVPVTPSTHVRIVSSAWLNHGRSRSAELRRDGTGAWLTNA